MRNSWWKILGVALVFYGLIAGMLVPLKPNISDSSPFSAPLGQPVTVEVTGYNTRFAASENRAWLRIPNPARAEQIEKGEEVTAPDWVIPASRVEVIDDRRAKITYALPAALPTAGEAAAASILMSSPANGSFTHPAALSLRNPTSATNEAAWTATEITDLDQFPGMTFPYRSVLDETIRNTYFHVSLWLAMMLIFIGGVVQAVKYLRTGKVEHDRKSLALTSVGLFYGILGLLTGMIWAQYTWGSPWSFDVKQNMTAVALLIYAAYFILRGSFEDDEKRARIASAYNIFAFVALIRLIYVVPRLSESLHPGAGGNPALGGEDLDNTMRMIFYPIIIGWTLFGVWLATLQYRWMRVEGWLLDR